MGDWNLESSEIHFIRVSQNFIYLVVYENNKYILRLTPMGNKDRIQLEIDFLIYLHLNGINENIPIKSADSNFIKRYTFFDYNIQAVLYHYIEGGHYESEKLTNKT
ncbi:hypothetical protein [Bacillus pakistanensis]|uniref:hypothetical protein n=1 Tax=Rossellomorea pakistanensis TaxID=992288 RepID=UPI001965FD9E|nr:hypothetical protein [Bacillus pakistanensis]